MLSVAVAALALSQVQALDMASMTYDAFLAEHGEARSEDSVGYEQRKQLFEQSLKNIQRHNNNPHATWRAGLNRFADYTAEEYRAMLGHRRGLRGQASSGVVQYANASSAGGGSFLQVRSQPADLSAKRSVKAVDWSSSAERLAIKDQGSCGSCWALAAVTSLEMTAMAQTKKDVGPTSFEQLVDCVPNPKACGGTGGCQGATAELAFEYISKYGLVSQDAYPNGYTKRGSKPLDQACTGAPAGLQPVIRTAGFVKLPENELEPVMNSLIEKGPLVVSVDASNWQTYAGGVFSDCDKDAIVNHAVTLTGFGPADAKNGIAKDYWRIRNSWGPGWGEKGHILLERHSGDIKNKKDGYCGTDNKPLEGVGCKGGDPSIPVCGMCGVLSDTSYPTGVSLVQ